MNIKSSDVCSISSYIYKRTKETLPKVILWKKKERKKEVKYNADITFNEGKSKKCN